MAKIAVEFQPLLGRATGHARGGPARRLVARGDGWSVSDVICTAGPRDRPFEEQHAQVCVAVVMAGSFQYRSSAGRELMTPGSILLGNAGQYFECGHEHGVGDRCLSFAYEQQYFEGLVAEAGVQGRKARFSTLRVPPRRELSLLVARACAGLAESGDTTLVCEQSSSTAEAARVARSSLPQVRGSNGRRTDWEEIGLELAVRVLDFASGGEPSLESSPATEARVTRIVRMIEGRPDLEHGLGALAQEVKLSRYHFLRIFRQLTGLTPHRYILRARLRRAATRLMLEPARVLDIAFDSGFGDVSNFNHAFRAEFGVSPRSHRRNAAPQREGRPAGADPTATE